MVVLVVLVLLVLLFSPRSNGEGRGRVYSRRGDPRSSARSPARYPARSFVCRCDSSARGRGRGSSSLRRPAGRSGIRPGPRPRAGGCAFAESLVAVGVHARARVVSRRARLGEHALDAHAAERSRRGDRFHAPRRRGRSREFRERDALVRDDPDGFEVGRVRGDRVAIGGHERIVRRRRGVGGRGDRGGVPVPRVVSRGVVSGESGEEVAKPVAEHILGDPLGAHDEESRARGFVLGVFVRVRGGTAGGGTGGGRRVCGGAGPRLRVGVVGEHDAQEAFTPSEKSPRRGDAALERAFAVRLVAHRLERARCRGGARELDVRHALVPEHAHGPHLAERREEIPKLGLRHAATAHHEQPRVRRAGRLGHRHAPGTNRSSRRAVRDGVGGGANPVNERPRVEPGRRDETRDKSRFRQRILSPSSHNRWHLCASCSCSAAYATSGPRPPLLHLT